MRDWTRQSKPALWWSSYWKLLCAGTCLFYSNLNTFCCGMRRWGKEDLIWSWWRMLTRCVEKEINWSIKEKTERGDRLRSLLLIGDEHGAITDTTSCSPSCIIHVNNVLAVADGGRSERVFCLRWKIHWDQTQSCEMKQGNQDAILQVRLFAVPAPYWFYAKNQSLICSHTHDDPRIPATVFL